MKYDRQDVIEKATAFFWKKGFHATSMRNLQEVIDMRPGSIYAGFGSKEGLFKEALQYYANAGLERLAACAEATPSPLEAVKDFLKMAVSKSSPLPSDMCMLVKSIAELTEDNADLLAEARRLLGTIQNALAELLTQAKECGELDESKNPQRMARFLQMQLMGLHAYTRAYTGDIQVNELIDDAFACLQ